MSFSQIPTSVSIISSGLKSYQAISLTNFVTSAASLIASGSAIEIANAFFLADGNITPNASSWTAVGTGNTAYIVVTPSGSAGVQILTAAYTDTAPFWSTSKGAWYASAASLTRYIGGVYKGGATSYKRAFILGAKQERVPPTFSTKILEIGTWNMVDDSSVTVAHGLDVNSIRNVSVVIRHDDAENTRSLDFSSSGDDVAGMWTVNLTDVNLLRTVGGGFANISYDTMGDDGNRGWVTIEYGP